MSMQVGGDAESREYNSTINTTPLVDIMLVLLIIFLITIPVIRNTIHVNLPNAVNIPTTTKPENIAIYVTQNGDIYWNLTKMSNEQDLVQHVNQVAVEKPQPEIHIRADKNVEYSAIGRVLYAIQRGGVVKVGFITEPDKNSLAQFLNMQH